MKIILCDSPSWRLFEPRMFIPLSVVFLGAALRAGHEVRILSTHDLTSWDGQNMTIHRDRLPPCDVLGMSSSSASMGWASSLAYAWPARVKILGGYHASGIMGGKQNRFKHPRFFSGFDYILAGEGEEALTQFCDSLQEGNLPAIDGLFKVRNDTLFPMGKKAVARIDIEKSLPPAFDLWEGGFNLGALFTKRGTGFLTKKLPSASLLTSRGCPYGCKFCPDARTISRKHTLEHIEKQVRLLVSLGVKAVNITDDIFIIQADRVKAISDILHGYGVIFKAQGRADLGNENLFRYICANGCSELALGVEHASTQMLTAMGKKTTPQQNETAIRMIQDAGMTARIFLLPGFPGETRETLRELRDWLSKIRPDAVGVNLFQPYPGTDVWNYPEKYGVTIPDDCFDRMWSRQWGFSKMDSVLDLPTISKNDFLEGIKEICQLIEEEIEPLNRMKLKNGGLYGNRALQDS